MSQLRFFLSHYSVIGLLTVVCYLIGNRLLQRFQFNSRIERFCFSVALGLGVMAYLTLTLAVAGLLYRPAIILTLLIAVTLCYPIWSQWPRKLSRFCQQIKESNKDRRRLLVGLGFASLLFALSIPLWLLPLYPPVGSDETMYHLPIAKQYVESHRAVFAMHVRFPVFPQTNEMLFAVGLLLYDDVLAHLFQILFLTLLTMAMIGSGLRFFTASAGWLAAAILLANPLVLWSGTIAYVEIALILFTTLTFYSFWIWSKTRQDCWLILAGVFCGFAIGTKYTALFFLIAIQMAAFWVGVKERRYFRTLIFGLVTITVSAPWFVRNFYYMRNPVFPYFYKPFVWVFGQGKLDPALYSGITRELSSYGVGKSLRALVLLPWYLSFRQNLFVVEAPLAPLFLLLPVLIICAFGFRQLRALVLITLAQTLFWFTSAQVLRYLLPAIPFLCLATAATLDYFFQRIPYVKKLSKNKTISVLAGLVLVSPGWVYVNRALRYKGSLPTNQAQRDAHLTERLPSYPAYQLLNQLRSSNYKVYAYNDANMNYFANGLFMGDWFGPAQYEFIDNNLASGQKLYEQLKNLGADYFLLRSAHWPGHLPDDQFFKTHFRPIYTQSDISLYELSERPFHQQVIELLQNPGFEQLNQRNVTGWTTSGTPFIDGSGRNSASGSVAVKCIGASDVIYQRVAVTTAETYVLASQARGLEQSAIAKLQVDWLDAQGVLLKEDVFVINLGDTWARYQKRLVAPADATVAIVYLDGLDHYSVWFDDASFARTTYESQP